MENGEWIMENGGANPERYAKPSATDLVTVQVRCDK